MYTSADDEWHAVHIGRYEGFVTLEVDGETEQVNLENPVPVLYDKDIYIGGGSNLGLFHGVRSKLNFVGCLQQVSFIVVSAVLLSYYRQC